MRLYFLKEKELGLFHVISCELPIFNLNHLCNGLIGCKGFIYREDLFAADGFLIEPH
jgi:hypothetical protein